MFTSLSLGLTLRRRLYTGRNTGSMPEVVCDIMEVVPVGAIVSMAMLRLPYLSMSS